MGFDLPKLLFFGDGGTDGGGGGDGDRISSDSSGRVDVLMVATGQVWGVAF